MLLLNRDKDSKYHFNKAFSFIRDKNNLKNVKLLDW